MRTIGYQEILLLMEEADHEHGSKTFSLVHLTLDKRRKTGGDWVKIEGAKKCGLPYHCADHEMRGIIDANGKKTAVHLRLIFEFNEMTVYP